MEQSKNHIFCFASLKKSWMDFCNKLSAPHQHHDIHHIALTQAGLITASAACGPAAGAYADRLPALGRHLIHLELRLLHRLVNGRKGAAKNNFVFVARPLK